MIQKSDQLTKLLRANPELHEALNNILSNFQKLYRSYSPESCFLLERIIVDLFKKHSIIVKTEIHRDLKDNVKMIILFE